MRKNVLTKVFVGMLALGALTVPQMVPHEASAAKNEATDETAGDEATKNSHTAEASCLRKSRKNRHAQHQMENIRSGSRIRLAR